MPKYIVSEELLREWASYGEEDGSGMAFDVEEEIARHKREADGSLSQYSPAQCSINEEKLHERSRLVLAELRRIGILQLIVDYDGGGDEDFTYFRAAKLADGGNTFDELVGALQSGPVGDAIQAPPNPRYHSYRPVERSRAEWTSYKIEFSIHDLACHLLGQGFGTGEGSLVGSFVADLQANTLTDVAEETLNQRIIDYEAHHWNFDGELLEDYSEVNAHQIAGSTLSQDNPYFHDYEEEEQEAGLNTHKPTRNPLNVDQLRPTARLALEQLRLIGVTQITVRYEGGDTENFAYFRDAKSSLGTLDFEELVKRLEEGPLGEKPETPFYYHPPGSEFSVTRRQWTQEGLNLFIHELLWQLLGSSAPQSALEGSFIADLMSNTLTDIVPEDE